MVFLGTGIGFAEIIGSIESSHHTGQSVKGSGLRLTFLKRSIGDLTPLKNEASY